MDQISRQLSVSQISGSLYRSTGCKNLGIEFQDLGHRYVIFHRWKKKCACIIWLILLIYRHLVKCKLEKFLIAFKVFYRFSKNEYHHLAFFFYKIAMGHSDIAGFFLINYRNTRILHAYILYINEKYINLYCTLLI